MRKSLALIISSLLFFTAVVRAQIILTDTLKATDTESYAYEHLSQFYSWYPEPYIQKPDPSKIDSFYYKTSLFRRWEWGKAFALGITNQRVWLRVVVKNNYLTKTRFFLTLYSFVDTAVLYKKNEKSYSVVAGSSSWMPSEYRIANTRCASIPFALETNETAEYLFYVEQKAGRVYFPLDISHEYYEIYFEQTYLADYNWLWVMGIFIFLILSSFLLYTFLQAKVYLFYCCYILFNLLFLIMEDSIDALIFGPTLYKLIWQIGQYNFLLLSACFSLLFMQNFLLQKNYYPRLYKTGLLFCSLLFIVFIISTLLNYYSVHHAGFNINPFLFKLRMVLIFLSLLFIIFSIGLSLRHQKKITFYYMIAFAFYMIGIISFLVNNSSILRLHFVEPNLFVWGLCMEGLIFLILLMGRFKYTLQVNTFLELKVIQAQKSQMKQIIQTQETERKRIAEDLHDELGSSLAALKLRLQKTALQGDELKDLLLILDKASSDTRNISHNLMPPEFERTSLQSLLSAYYVMLNNEANIRFQFHCSNNKQFFTKENELIIYRILMELTNNILVHSKAVEATIQLIYFDNYLEIMVEDNGKGFTQGGSNGIGLKNVQSRINYLNGNLRIDSGINGSTFMIKLPYKIQPK